MTFVTFRANLVEHLEPLLHLGPNFITFMTNLLLHLGTLLHLGPTVYYI